MQAFSKAKSLPAVAHVMNQDVMAEGWRLMWLEEAPKGQFMAVCVSCVWRIGTNHLACSARSKLLPTGRPSHEFPARHLRLL
jgi:hypothetical protein